jgi:hypothetical protein
MEIHPDAIPPEGYPFYPQPKALFLTIFTGEGDSAARRHDPMPRQPGLAIQRPHGQPRGPRESGEFGRLAVGDHFPARHPGDHASDPGECGHSRARRGQLPERPWRLRPLPTVPRGRGRTTGPTRASVGRVRSSRDFPSRSPLPSNSRPEAPSPGSGSFVRQPGDGRERVVSSSRAEGPDPPDTNPRFINRSSTRGAWPPCDLGCRAA